MGRFIEAIEAIKDCAKPVVARLNGMVVGGGNELNIACDLAVAADDIVLKHVGPARGSLPSGGATQWMPLLVGDRRAREIVLLDRPVSAQQAVEWGWINRAVPRAQLDSCGCRLLPRNCSKRCLRSSVPRACSSTCGRTLPGA